MTLFLISALVAFFIQNCSGLSSILGRSCKENYYGKSCDLLCKPRNDNFGHYTCGLEGEKVCMDGWDKDIEHAYCTKPKCAEGCHGSNGYCDKPNQCTCHEGWQGALCDECKRYPGCVHGSCSGPFTCECKNGWGGLLCNKDLNYCTNHRPCKNGATCYNTGEKLYTCSCPVGFVGEHCETHETLSIDCDTNVCENGGTCFGIADDFSCVCPYGFVGKNCEQNYDDCKNNPCVNGGTCNDGINDFTCNCKEGFTGKDCSVQVDECESFPCFNQGFCIDGNNSFSCRCLARYSGDYCQVRPDGTTDPLFLTRTTLLPIPSSSSIPSSNIALTGTLSALVPLVVIIAAIAVICMKQKRKTEQRRADFEAQMENELNAVTLIEKSKIVNKETAYTQYG